MALTRCLWGAFAAACSSSQPLVSPLPAPYADGVRPGSWPSRESRRMARTVLDGVEVKPEVASDGGMAAGAVVTMGPDLGSSLSRAVQGVAGSALGACTALAIAAVGNYLAGGHTFATLHPALTVRPRPQYPTPGC